MIFTYILSEIQYRDSLCIRMWIKTINNNKRLEENRITQKNHGKIIQWNHLQQA